MEEWMVYSITCWYSSLVRSLPVTRIAMVHRREVKRMSKVQKRMKNLLEHRLREGGHDEEDAHLVEIMDPCEGEEPPKPEAGPRAQEVLEKAERGRTVKMMMWQKG